MNITINGEPREIETVAFLAELLRRCDLDPEAMGIAVARNGEVIRRRDLGLTPVGEGDRIEIVRAVQGG